MEKRVDVCSGECAHGEEAARRGEADKEDDQQAEVRVRGQRREARIVEPLAEEEVAKEEADAAVDDEVEP